MITKLTIAAAAILMGTAATAQTTEPMSPGPAQSTMQNPDSGGMSPPSATSPNGNLSGGSYDSSKPGMGMGTTSAMASDGITMVNGKYMMGDRPATKAEIKAHKKMMKDNKG